MYARWFSIQSCCYTAVRSIQLEVVATPILSSSFLSATVTNFLALFPSRYSQSSKLEYRHPHIVTILHLFLYFPLFLLPSGQNIRSFPRLLRLLSTTCSYSRHLLLISPLLMVGAFSLHPKLRILRRNLRPSHIYLARSIRQLSVDERKLRGSDKQNENKIR